jgi:hypothetical protein
MTVIWSLPSPGERAGIPMQAFYRYLTAVLFVAIVVQVGLGGYGAFYGIHAADKHAVTKKTIEDGFNAHGLLGTVIAVAMLLLLIVALAGRFGSKRIKLAGGLFALGVLQLILGVVSTSVPWIGFLHTVNALAIFALAGLIAHQAWTKQNV